VTERNVVPIRGPREEWRLPSPAPGQANVVSLVASRPDVEVDLWSLRCPEIPGFLVHDLPLVQALRAASQVFTDEAGPTVLRVEFPEGTFQHLEAGQHDFVFEPPTRPERPDPR